jgi:hypothetical protein
MPRESFFFFGILIIIMISLKNRAIQSMVEIKKTAPSFLTFAKRSNSGFHSISIRRIQSVR